MFIYKCFPCDSHHHSSTHRHLQSQLYWRSRRLIALLKGTLTVGGQHYSLHTHTFFSKHLIICCPPTFPPAIQLLSSDPLPKKQSSSLSGTRMKCSHNTCCVLGIRVWLSWSSSCSNTVIHSHYLRALCVTTECWKLTSINPVGIVDSKTFQFYTFTNYAVTLYFTGPSFPNNSPEVSWKAVCPLVLIIWENRDFLRRKEEKSKYEFSILLLL